VREQEAPYVAWVRTLSCIKCAKPGPSDPAHMTLGPNEKGSSLKVDDLQVVPLCRSCHSYWDGVTDGPANPFREPDGSRPKEVRWEQARRWVAATQLAAIPDDFDAALEFAEAGLGRITHDTEGRWQWVPTYADPLKPQEPTT
jgi:hypothetical protein